MSEPTCLPPIDLEHSSFADFYDELPLWSAPFALQLLERVPLRAGATVLDVGCGTGFLAIELAQRCGAQSRVYAIDPWPAAMARLGRKLSYHGIDNVHLVERDGADTRLPSELADVIVSNLGINNFDNAAAVLAECRRLAKPGARLLLTTNLAGHMAELYAEYAAVLRELGREECLAALQAHEAHRGTVASIQAQLEHAGFTMTHVATAQFRLRFSNGTALFNHWFMRLAFVPAWQAIAGAQDAPRLLAALVDRLNARAAREGELALSIPMALLEAQRAA